MRRVDLFCASQAATSVRLAYTGSSPASSSSSSTFHLGSSPAIDRHNPIITDHSRATKPTPSLPESATSTPKNDKAKKGKNKNKKNEKIDFLSTISCAKGGGFISPSGSTRFLLGERTRFLEVEPDFEPVVPVLLREPTDNADKFEIGKKLDMEYGPVLNRALSSRSLDQGPVHRTLSFEPVVPVLPGEPTDNADKFETGKKFDMESGPVLNRASSSRSSDQVVVLRVSLHCKGCAGKVKKHISRMQGVTSFNIDFAAKKVTVVGDVTPLEVLASISKVKTAQLWTPPKQPSHPSTATSTYSDINKSKAVVA